MTSCYTYIDELRKAQGTKEKMEVLRRYKDNEEFCLFLYYLLNPALAYNVSEKTLRLRKGESYTEAMQLVFFETPFECCEFLAGLRGVDAATIRQVKLLLYGYCHDELEREILIKLFAKTLRLGVTAKTVNKVIPGLIPSWEIQQAYPIESYPVEPGTHFWLTQKLNGNRATFYKGRLIARSGTPYTGLEHIENTLREFCEVNAAVLDGELLLKDSAKGDMSDNEAFRKATGILNGNKNKTSICFRIFDIIPLSDFEAAEPKTPYSVRRMVLERAALELNTDCTSVLPLLYYGTDQHMIDKLLDQMVAEDKEGLMLNLDVPYYRTRHRGILKVKRFYTMDLPIVGVEEGTGRLEGTLGALILDYKGNQVRVGSGFTDDQRTAIWRDVDNTVGCLCEVKYKEISKDKNTGLESLQFPVFVRLRKDKTDISFG